MSKPTPTRLTFFFPDPFGTGESIAVQAENREEALKQLAQHTPTSTTEQQSDADAPETKETH